MSNYKFTTAFPIGIAHAEINDIEYINTLKDVVLENYNSDKRNVQSTHTLSVDRDDDPDWVTRGYPWQSNALQHKREVYSKLIDFVNENIRANSICPGTVNTPWVERITQNYDNPEKARELMRQRQPLGRLGEPDEIAMAAVYLASDESKFITGTSLIIDGGLTMS